MSVSMMVVNAMKICRYFMCSNQMHEYVVLNSVYKLYGTLSHLIPQSVATALGIVSV